eukprot:9270328-Pyramimonas_sp.AAC.1
MLQGKCRTAACTLVCWLASSKGKFQDRSAPETWGHIALRVQKCLSTLYRVFCNATWLDETVAKECEAEVHATTAQAFVERFGRP